MHVLILGGTPAERTEEARRRASAPLVLDAATLPFTRVTEITLPRAPRTILIEGIERAFPDNQTRGTRLVLTQSTYLLQTWLDALASDDRIVATADRAALEQCAPEVLRRRGPWQRFEIESDGSRGSGLGASRPPSKSGGQPRPPSPFSNAASPEPPAPSPVAAQLAAAYATRDAAERLRLCRDASERAPDSAVAQLALASAYREHQDLRARDALERAASLAPDWPAVPYEIGKLWLVLDDTTRARDAFRRAGELMPSFAAAFSNLGATLGELDDPEAAFVAFRQALAYDPDNPTILSNVGVVARELGRLDDSETALRRVVAIDPAFVFGYYNLGHTLFLAGRYADAVAAYEDGAGRDPQKSPRQICRLAMARFASGDLAGAERELWPAVNRAAPADREDLLLEACEIAHALVAARPELAAHRAFADRLAAEIVKSE